MWNNQLTRARQKLMTTKTLKKLKNRSAKEPQRIASFPLRPRNFCCWAGWRSDLALLLLCYISYERVETPRLGDVPVDRLWHKLNQNGATQNTIFVLYAVANCDYLAARFISNNYYELSSHGFLTRKTPPQNTLNPIMDWNPPTLLATAARPLLYGDLLDYFIILYIHCCCWDTNNMVVLLGGGYVASRCNREHGR